jgi:hypothetical protein
MFSAERQIWRERPRRLTLKCLTALRDHGKPMSVAARATPGLLSFLPAISVSVVLWLLFGIGGGEWLEGSERTMGWFVVSGVAVTADFLTGLGLAAYYYSARVFTPEMRRPSRLLARHVRARDFATLLAAVVWAKADGSGAGGLSRDCSRPLPATRRIATVSPAANGG